MKIRYNIDEETELPHIYEHGVIEEEVEYILRNSRLRLKGRGNSRIALGQTQAGRFLKVIFARARDGEGLFVITAYELRGKALAAYRRRCRKKQR